MTEKARAMVVGGITGTAPEPLPRIRPFTSNSFNHQPLTLWAELPGIVQDFECLWIFLNVQTFQHRSQSSLVDYFDAMLFSQLFCIAGITVECDEDAMLNLGISQSA
jgi:hypothetical protein